MSQKCVTDVFATLRSTTAPSLSTCARYAASNAFAADIACPSALSSGKRTAILDKPNAASM
eukprot:4987460-Amphidinium_carterae.1